jgi:DNA-binding transcriptional MerR regulator
MMNPTTRRLSTDAAFERPSRALQLFDPPDNAVYTVQAAARFAGVTRRTILVYCKHHLLSPVSDAGTEGYSFDRDGLRSLRRIEALRVVCGDNLASIKVILDMTRELERLQAVVRFLSRQWQPKPGHDSQWGTAGKSIKPQKRKIRT